MSSDASTTRVYLVRHGQVAREWAGRIYGDLDVPLAAVGEEQARAAAERLDGVELNAVISSGLARAEFGAALLRTARGLERRDRPALRELERGAWRGRTPSEVDEREDGAFTRWHTAPAELRAPGGESLSDLASRVLPELRSLAAAHAGGTIAIVAHSWVVRVALCDALGLHLDLAPRLSVRTGAIAALDLPRRAELRPTFAGLELDRSPGGPGWFRGPHRGR
jgi:broad specificity phosphatase PhoE